MDYFILEYSEDDGIDKFIMANDYNLNGFDYRKFWKGDKIENWEDNIELYYENEGQLLDYTPNVLSWMIFSDSVINIFQELGVRNFQAFSVKLINKLNKKKVHISNVVNITCQFNVLDWEKSDLITWEDDPKYIKFIRTLVIDISKLDTSIDIFRLAESKNYIIVSERFKNKIEERNLKGFGFCKIELKK